MLDRPCQECGFDPAAVEVAQRSPTASGANATDWVRRLGQPGAERRRRPGVVNAGVRLPHSRRAPNLQSPGPVDVTEDKPQFPDWDQDETAIADDYASPAPATVATELFDAARHCGRRLREASDAWTRRGLRSNGSEFTVATISIYHLPRDIVHHAYDVAR